MVERIKLVSKFVRMGFSVPRIARELDYSASAAKKDVAAIISRHREVEDIDEHLRNVTERTREQLSRLEESRAILAKQLDWASEWTLQWIYPAEGIRVPELDENNVQASGPRKPLMVPGLVSQIQSLDKQISELLGLFHKQIDITVKLEQTERIQGTIVEMIREAAPEVYLMLRRRLEAINASSGEKRVAMLTGAKASEEFIDVDYKETG